MCIYIYTYIYTYMMYTCDNISRPYRIPEGPHIYTLYVCIYIYMCQLCTTYTYVYIYIQRERGEREIDRQRERERERCDNRYIHRLYITIQMYICMPHLYPYHMPWAGPGLSRDRGSSSRKSEHSEGPRSLIL